MAKSSIPSPEESLAGMAKTGAPRQPMNREGTKFSSGVPKKGTLVKKGSTAAKDPAAQPVGVRQNVPSTRDRNGATYGIKTSYMKSTSPEAGATMANARKFKSVINRTNPNFSDGADAIRSL